MNDLKSDFSHDDWYMAIEKSAPEVQSKLLAQYISKACGAFDLAATIAWHSNIPGLWETVVTEWQDGITHTWEAGAPFLAERLKRSRMELFECFSVLYVAALELERMGRAFYPYYGPVRQVACLLSSWRWLVAVKAKRCRDRVFQQVKGCGEMTH